MKAWDFFTSSATVRFSGRTVIQRVSLKFDTLRDCAFQISETFSFIWVLNDSTVGIATGYGLDD
jgi:hypothetical protein